MKKILLLVALLSLPNVVCAQLEYDMLGNLRGQDGTWDKGAYEYTGEPTPGSDYTVTFILSGNGRIEYNESGGSVADCTSAEYGGGSGSDCTPIFDAGDDLTLVSVPQGGYRFGSISGADSNARSTTLNNIAEDTTVTVVFTAYAAPTNLACTSGDNTFTCTWSAASPEGSYDIYYDTDLVLPYMFSTNTGTTRSFTENGLAAGNYYFSVRAKTSDGDTSLYTAPVAITVTDPVTPGCSGDSDCSGGTPYCVVATGDCVQCRSAEHCTNGLWCDGQEVCTNYLCADSANPCDPVLYDCYEANDQCILKEPPPQTAYDILVDFELNSSCSDLGLTDHNVGGVTWSVTNGSILDCIESTTYKEGSKSLEKSSSGGTNGYLAGALVSAVSGRISYGMWFNTGTFCSTCTSTSEYTRLLYSMNTSSNGIAVSVGCNSAAANTCDIDMTCIGSGCTGLVDGTTALSGSTWYYLTCYDDGAVSATDSLYCRVYDVNGNLIQTTAGTSTLAGGPTIGFRIGGASTDLSTSVFIDDVQVNYTYGTYPLLPIEYLEGCTTNSDCVDNANGEYCNLAENECVQCLQASHCTSNELFCDGNTLCVNNACIESGNPCSGYLGCDEESDYCVECYHWTDCDDGLFCNGQEICSDSNQCESQFNPCGALVCNEDTNTCGSTASTASTTIPIGSNVVYLYLDPTEGDDGNHGQSSSRPWASLNMLKELDLVPGTKIRLKDGATFSGTLTLDDNGTASNPIVIESYGE